MAVRGVSAVRELSRADARRLAVRAQLLDRPRPSDLLDVVRRLTVLQSDGTDVVAPNAHLVAWSRLGSAYSMNDLDDALADGSLVELRGMIRPGADLALYRADFAAWPGSGDVGDWKQAQSEWMEVNDGFRRDILDRLRSDGPLAARDLPDTSVVSWRSSGWNNNRNVGMMLEFMEQRGEIAVAGRSGRDRLWDLAARIHPDGPTIPSAEAARLRDERRLRSLGICRARGPECPVEPQDVGEVGEPAVVDGVRGQWRIDPELLDRPFRGRAALLSPLDRLVFDRKRMADIFAFDYQLEMYKPIAKRRWGYWAMPILHGDRLVGKLDATADRKRGVLRVDAVHEDEPFSPAVSAAVHREITDLATWLRLDLAFSDLR
jgi:uncharacterized protein YcaQ